VTAISFYIPDGVLSGRAGLVFSHGQLSGL